MGTRIVVCDDEAHIVRAVSMKLSNAGFDVETASDGQAAWEAIQRETPALLVTDYQMPRLDGLSLCQRLREQTTTHDLPVILLTAKAFEMDHDKMKNDLGIAEIVFKPFSPRELLKMVNNILNLVEPVAN